MNDLETFRIIHLPFGYDIRLGIPIEGRWHWIVEKDGESVASGMDGDERSAVAAANIAVLRFYEDTGL
jgi:hypothetical protein